MDSPKTNLVSRLSDWTSTWAAYNSHLVPHSCDMQALKLGSELLVTLKEEIHSSLVHRARSKRGT